MVARLWHKTLLRSILLGPLVGALAGAVGACWVIFAAVVWDPWNGHDAVRLTVPLGAAAGALVAVWLARDERRDTRVAVTVTGAAAGAALGAAWWYPWLGWYAALVGGLYGAALGLVVGPLTGLIVILTLHRRSATNREQVAARTGALAGALLPGTALALFFWFATGTPSPGFWTLLLVLTAPFGALAGAWAVPRALRGDPG